MILVDFSHTVISTLMAEIKGQKDIEVDEELMRYMIINCILSYKKKFSKKYGQLVLATDSRVPSWRKEAFPYYKANRKKDRDNSGIDWKSIFDIMRLVSLEISESFPYPVLSVDGAEADDIIAVMAKWQASKNPDSPFLIISGDQDFLQLQKYKTVEQYAPVTKKMLRENDPENYLYEHIMRGDFGDGVPNVLSTDDCLVSGVRQKPITAIRLAEWKKTDLNLLENYQRNKRLIDFSEIPESIESQIINSFVMQPDKDRSKLYDYFMKHRMKQLLIQIEDF